MYSVRRQPGVEGWEGASEDGSELIIGLVVNLLASRCGLGPFDFGCANNY
jgi:hypothetical protein